MKLHEVLEPTNLQLDEGIVRNVLAAAGIALAAIPASLLHTPVIDAVPVKMDKAKSATPRVDMLVAKAAAKYRVDPKIVSAAVLSAIKYQHSDFPTAKDILAVVGTESSFNPAAKSQLKTDPAQGLMQVRPGVWKLPAASMDTIDSQIKTGAQILRQYYVKLGDREAALHAYNVGLTNHKTGKVTNPRYVPKVNKERDLYKDI